MRLLLDTHVLLWWLMNDRSLNTRVWSAIANPGTSVFVSAASAWEIAIKQALGKLEAPNDLERQIEANRFEPLSITIEHACSAGTLPPYHDDPFDRMLVAQAMSEGLTIATRDPRIERYGIATVLA